MEKIVRERLKQREEAIKEALSFSECASTKLGKMCSILFGSYARGDFNEWSDIDVLIVAEGVPRNPLERLSLLDECLWVAPRVEPLVVSLEEFFKFWERNPAIIDAVKSGVVLLDNIGLKDYLWKMRRASF